MGDVYNSIVYPPKSKGSTMQSKTEIKSLIAKYEFFVAECFVRTQMYGG